MPTLSVESPYLFFFFFNDTATTEIYTLSLHDALPISVRLPHVDGRSRHRPGEVGPDIARHVAHVEGALGADQPVGLVARLRRGVDPAPLRQVSQEPAPFDDGHRDGEQHRVARGPEAPDGAGIRSGGRPDHRGVDQLACARTVQD